MAMPYLTRRQFLKLSTAAAVWLPFHSRIPLVQVDPFTIPEAIAQPITPSIPLILKHPEAAIYPPQHHYNLLLLGQGFSNESAFWNAVNHFWTQLPNIEPFGHINANGSAHYNFSCYCDPGLSLDLGLSRDPQNYPAFSISKSVSDKLESYLAERYIGSIYGSVYNVPALEIWPRTPKAGRAGSLIAIIKDGQGLDYAAEFYDLTGYDGNFPMVAVATFGLHWISIIARGIGQTLVGLGDEFELDGADFKQPPGDMIYDVKNLIYITDAQRADIKSDVNKRRELIDKHYQWRTANAIAFEPNQTINANTPSRRGVSLVEGGGGYRHNVLRSDHDCLMRRIPASFVPRPPNAANLPIQDSVSFCSVCKRLIEAALRTEPDMHFLHITANTVLLSSQYLEVDAHPWNKHTPMQVPAKPFTVTDKDAKGARWSVTAEVNDSDGLVLKNLQLTNRDDPFQGSDDVVDMITFKDLAVRFDNTGLPDTALDVKHAFENTMHPPKLELFEDGGLGSLGLKLTLTWSDIEGLDFEVVMSLALRRQNNDIDPGGAAIACKLYPQLAMSYRTSKGKVQKKKVKELIGTVSISPNNVIKETSAVKNQFPNIQFDTLTVILVTDSNSSNEDGDIVIPGSIVKVPIYNDTIIPIPLPKFIRKRRRIAGVGGYIPAMLARFRHLYFGGKPLVHWSWLFDYGMPVTSEKCIVAVYRDGDKTPQGNNGGRYREKLIYQWPTQDLADSADSPSMFIRKVPRQGDYDNIHFAPDLGPDALGRPTMSAPFCADKCLHLHTRWGTIASSVAVEPYGFVGWGNGMFNQGAHRVRGAPLVPPNQRVELHITQPEPSRAIVQYKVRAALPQHGAKQVFLEQGLSFAFSYKGLNPLDRWGLSYALGVDPAPVIPVPVLPSEVRTRDIEVRKNFHEIYHAIRWFSPKWDGVTSPNVQQIPGGTNFNIDQSVDPVIEGY